MANEQRLPLWHSDQLDTHTSKVLLKAERLQCIVLTAQIFSAERARVALRGVLAARPYNGVLATRHL